METYSGGEVVSHTYLGTLQIPIVKKKIYLKFLKALEHSEISKPNLP